MKKLYPVYLSIVSIALFIQSSCTKFVQTDGPKNQLTSAAVFADSTNANAAVLGIYVNMMQVGSFGFCSGALSLYPGLSGDELYLSANDASTAQFYNNQLLPDNDKLQSLYIYAYKYIYETNACIEGISASPKISDANKSVFIGEAKFLRAFFYFNLVNLYGAVPLVTTTDYNITRLTARSPTDIVYAQIIADLKYAQANLPLNSSLKERANYYSATALLAKVYLFTGQYVMAAAEADKVITSGKFAIVSNLNSVFLSSSNETIWNLLPVIQQQATYEGLYFVPTTTTAKPKYVITNSLYNSFETGDLRKSNWIKANTVTGQLYPYPYKYRVGRTTGAITENSVVFRLAEMYLIRAEANANTGNLNVAINDLNVIRKRAGLGVTSAVDKSSVLLAIEKERQAELFCEWGNRWFDLKRTNRAAQVLGPSKVNFKSTSVLYPIPVSELNANPNLTQNAGY
jgi:hypothetical protein